MGCANSSSSKDEKIGSGRGRRLAAPYVGCYEHGLKQMDGELKIHYKRAVLDMDALREHGAVSIIL